LAASAERAVGARCTSPLAIGYHVGIAGLVDAAQLRSWVDELLAEAPPAAAE
jgi:hypothetical protein